jgi:hypothetical protein
MGQMKKKETPPLGRYLGACLLRNFGGRFYCHCRRCAHFWITREAKPPQRCGRCKAFYWWRTAKGPRAKRRGDARR